MLRVRRKSNPIFLQNKTGKADAKSVWIGGDHPVVVQSMTTTDTADADKTLEQIYGLAMEGCEVVRVTVRIRPMPPVFRRSSTARRYRSSPTFTSTTRWRSRRSRPALRSCA